MKFVAIAFVLSISTVAAPAPTEQVDQLRIDGKLGEALELADQLVKAQPEHPDAYLSRAQVLIAMADAPSASDPAAAKRRAADDLDTYLRLSKDVADPAHIASMRDQLRADADALDAAAAPPEPRAEPPAPIHVAPDRGRSGKILLGVGLGTAALGAGIAAPGLFVRPQGPCEGASGATCGAGWRARPALLGVGLGLTGVGLGLATTGAVFLGQSGAADPARRAKLGWGIGGAGLGVGVVAGALGGAAGSVYNRAEGNDVAALSSAQALGQVALATGALGLVATVSGVALLLVGKKSRSGAEVEVSTSGAGMALRGQF